MTQTFELTLPIYLHEFETPLNRRHLDLVMRSVQEALRNRQAFWLRGLIIQHNLTAREVDKHCEITLFTEQSLGPEDFVHRWRFEINWTRWMRFKRWVRSVTAYFPDFLEP